MKLYMVRRAGTKRVWAGSAWGRLDTTAGVYTPGAGIYSVAFVSSCCKDAVNWANHYRQKVGGHWEIVVFEEVRDGAKEK